MRILSDSNICRLCGWEDETNLKILDLEICIVFNSLNLLTAKVSELIEQNLNLILRTDLDLPNKICQDCKTGVQVTAEFLAKVRQGQIYIQKLVRAKGDNILLQNDVRMECNLKLLQKKAGRRGRPKKGFEQKKAEDPGGGRGDSSKDQEVKRRRKPPKHWAEFETSSLDLAGRAEGTSRTENSRGIDLEDGKLNIDEEQLEEYKPPMKTLTEMQKGLRTLKNLLKVYKCEFCEEIRPTEESLRAHKESEHGDFMYRCAVVSCEILRRSKLELEMHQEESGHQGIITLSLFQPSPAQDSSNPDGAKLPSDREIKSFLLDPSELKPAEAGLGAPRLNLEETFLSEVTFTPVPPATLTSCEKGGGLPSAVGLGAEPTNPPAKVDHSCQWCSKSFVSHPLLLEHRCTELYCTACTEYFSTQPEFSAHQGTVHGVFNMKNYPCSDCGRTFNAASSLRYHRDAVHRKAGYTCPVPGCGKVCNVKNLLTRHMRGHGEERPFKCDTCNKKFKRYDTLKVHIGTHDEVAKTYCEICGQTFKHATSIRNHIKLHEGEKKYVCPYCGKAFTQNGNMKEHMRVHTGEKPFKCDKCPKQFATKSQLSNHVKRHNSSASYVCEQCFKTFLHLDNLKIHMKRHSGDKPYTCAECKKGFVDLTAFNKHMESHAGVRSRHPCKTCGKSYSDQSNLRKHMRTHGQGDEGRPTVWNIIRDAGHTADDPDQVDEDGDVDELQQVIYIAYEDRGEAMDPASLDLKEAQQIRLVAPLNIDPLTFAAEYLKDLHNIPVAE